LQPDRVGNGVVFGGRELGCVDLTLGEAARSRSNLAGRSKLPICSARNGG